MNLEPAAPGLARRLALLAAATAGASAMLTQLALLRELLGAVSGNELVLGLALGLWLLLSGVGARLGATRAAPAAAGRRLAAALAFLAVVPLLQVAAVRGLRDHVFPTGAAPGPGWLGVACAAWFAPYCLVSGAVFSLAACLATGEGHPREIGRVYAADTLGGLAGGALFTFALSPYLDHAALLCVPAALCCLVAAIVARDFGAPRLVIASLAGAMVFGTILVVGPGWLDDRTTQWQFREPVVLRAASPYGRLVVTRAAGQLTFHENGVPIVFTGNTGQVEESVLYAMAACASPRRVLLVSGAVAGAGREALRAGAGAVTALELDPRIIATGQSLLPENLSDPRLTLVAGDARRFIEQARGPFDVMIVALPDPATFQLNRYFTLEFMTAARRILAPGGVLAFGLGQYADYVSPELAHLLACAHRTAAAVFPHVRLVPGERVFFLASAAPLDADLASRLEARGIAGRLVNRHYLDVTLAPDRLAELERALAVPAGLNTDFSPALCRHRLRLWLSQFALPATGIVLLAAAGVLLYWLRLTAPAKAVFATGFAASALELVLLLGVQVLYGSLYRQLGIVVTVFMAGLAAGAALAARRVPVPASRRPIAALALVIAGLAALLPVMLAQLAGRASPAAAGEAVLWLYAFAAAVPVGALFAVAGGMPGREPGAHAAGLYAADLVGAALGALLAGALLVPLVGVAGTCLLIVALNLAAAALNWRLPAST